jgi:putative NADH-flavin reductase
MKHVGMKGQPHFFPPAPGWAVMPKRMVAKETLRRAVFQRPPRIAVLGATGKTGQEVVQQAIARGWPVRALVRPGTPIPPQWKGVDVVQGVPTDLAAVDELVRGCDAVVNALGHRKSGQTPGDLLQAATRNLLLAMPLQGALRLVVVTGGGVHFAEDRPGFVDRLARLLLRRAQPVMLADADTQRDLVVASTLDWTIVRAGRMRLGPAKGIRRVGVVGETGAFVTHADVAAFSLDAIAGGVYNRQAPMISN